MTAHEKTLWLLSTSYTNTDFEERFAAFFSQGILPGVDNQLAVSAGSGLSVTLATGRINHNGGVYYRLYKDAPGDPDLSLTLTTADPTNPRVDRIIVRYTFSTGVCAAAVLTGVPGASPSAPALTQNTTYWDYSLCQIAVAANAVTLMQANITDERGSPSLCGFAQVIGTSDTYIVAQNLDSVIIPAGSAVRLDFGASATTPRVKLFNNATAVYNSMMAVAIDAIPANQYGRVALQGLVSVVIQNNVTQGDALGPANDTSGNFTGQLQTISATPWSTLRAVQSGAAGATIKALLQAPDQTRLHNQWRLVR